MLTVALWRVAPQFRLIMWLAGYVLASLPRQILIISYQRSSPPVEHVIWWEKWFVVLTITAALFWGLAGVLLFPVHSMPHQFLLAIFVIGISCGAALAYWPNTFCYVPAILVELLPLSGRFIYEGDQVHVATGMIIAFFAMVLIVMGHHMQSMNSETLESKFKISSLADSLRRGRDELELKVEERTEELVELNKRLLGEITERKKTENELRHSEERYRSLVEDSFDGIFIQKGPKIIFANTRLYEMLGYFPGELGGMDHWLVYHPDYREITRRRAIARMNGEEVTPRYEVMLQKRDGSSFLGEISARPVHVDGQPGIKVWIRDISGQRRSEEAQRRMAAAIEQSIESVMITDRNGKIQYINPAFEHISGYRKEEVIGRDTRFLKSDSLDSSHYKDLLTAIRAGKPWKGRLLSQRKNGQIFYEDVAISPVHDSSGEIVNFVDVGHDVTENVELQMQLLQAQKMESLGTLAGGIAHDFNNLLQVVLGYSEFMLQRKKEGEPDYDGLQKIYQAGKRGADLVQSLLTFSRKVETKHVPVNLNQEITQVQHLLSRTIPKTIKIDLHLSGDLESIKADPSQVGQVLMNLGVNARDAMPNGGTLTIETANVHLDKEYCSSHLDAKPGNYVLLTVSDTGQGMDKKTLSHIFEPFFTTKEKGKGTGLGLATVYGIVKQHGGQINCYSEPGIGTTFTIYLPTIQTQQDMQTPTVKTHYSTWNGDCSSGG